MRLRGSALLLLALAAPAAAQRMDRDLAYGGDPAQRLDLSLPAAPGFPTVIFVHGGSLTRGDKADGDYRHVCEPFTAAGMGCANSNYRLAPGHAWPAQAEDVAAAVAWVHRNIGARGGDPARLSLFGHSSGATLVALVGADARYLAAHGMTTAGLHAVIPMGSIMWDDDLERAIDQRGRAAVEAAFRRDPDNAMFASLDDYLEHWPIRHVRAGLPRYLFLIAEAEQEQPPVLRTNRAFVEQAAALGNQADYRVLPGRTHDSALSKLGEPGDPVFALIRDFIDAPARDSLYIPNGGSSAVGP